MALFLWTGFFLILSICIEFSYAGYRNLNYPCSENEFSCWSNKKCISRRLRCNGRSYDCEDNSDEQDCYDYYRIIKQCVRPDYFLCKDQKMCIPLAWKCNEFEDCKDKSDEGEICKSDYAYNARRIKRNLTRKLLNQLDEFKIIPNEEISRTAVALYLAEPRIFDYDNKTGAQIAQKVSMKLLSRLALRQLEEIPSTELATYLNALVVTCISPLRYYDVDLVEELRSRIHFQNYTNPFVFLALCNAGEKLTASDVKQLEETFNKAHRVFWTDTQALVVMALACGSRQENSSVNSNVLRNFTMVLKNKQNKNGTIENLKTTALVLQAIFAANLDEENDTFNEEKAFVRMFDYESVNFENIRNIYYILPAFSFKSLASINANHCNTSLPNEDESLRNLFNFRGERWLVHYSIRVGDKAEYERTISLKAPANSSLYKIMEMAANLDSKLKFKVNINKDKLYVYSLAGIQDDPERGKFWFPFFLVKEGSRENLTAINESIGEVNIQEDQHFLLWYKKGDWLN